MRKILLSVIAVMMALGAQAKPPNVDIVSDEQFRFVCRYVDVFYGVECNDLKKPYVVTSKVVSSSYYGFYFKGETIVYVFPNLSPKTRSSTIVHETTHYVLDWTKSGFSRCESEEAARRVHHLWEGSKYNDRWRLNYRC